MAKSVDGKKVLLGRGKLYFNRFSAAGVPTGELFLGNVTSLSIQASDERRQMYSSADKASQLMADNLIRRTFELRATGTEYDPDRLALALAGVVGTLTQSASSAVNEVITDVLQGRYYKLAFRQVSAVVVTGPSATPTYVLGTDYEVDAVTGRIYIVPGGGIADLADLEVDYSYAAITGLKTVHGGTVGDILGSARYISNPVNGPTQELEIWRINMAPDGEVGFIGDEYGNWTLRGGLLDDSTVHPTYPLYRLIELAAGV